VLPTSTAEATK